MTTYRREWLLKLIENSQHEKAAKELNKLLSREPRSFSYQYLLGLAHGLAHEKAGELEKAPARFSSYTT